MKQAIILLGVLSASTLISCSSKPKQKLSNSAIERTCECSKLFEKQERESYLKYFEGDSTPYSGYCFFTRENGNEITYKYLAGHVLEIIERYPGGVLCEEMYYDTSGLITKRVHYYQNGQMSYKDFHGDHRYESFYDNGRIQRKGMYGLRKSRMDDRGKEFYSNTLYDSIWKKNGDFDSVYHYSQASITY